MDFPKPHLLWLAHKVAVPTFMGWCAVIEGATIFNCVEDSLQLGKHELVIGAERLSSLRCRHLAQSIVELTNMSMCGQSLECSFVFFSFYLGRGRLGETSGGCKENRPKC